MIIHTVEDLITQLKALPKDAEILIFDGVRDYVPIEIVDSIDDNNFVIEPHHLFVL